jgi:hypothetical protein
MTLLPSLLGPHHPKSVLLLKHFSHHPTHIRQVVTLFCILEEILGFYGGMLVSRNS